MRFESAIRDRAFNRPQSMISLDQPILHSAPESAAAHEFRPPVRRLHKRNALLLAIALFAAVFGFYTAHDLQTYRLANRLLDEARAARKQQKYRESAKRLEEYVQLHPNDDQARVRLALDRAEAARSDWELLQAALDIEALLVRFPDDRELRRKAAELMIIGGRTADALIHIELLMESAPADAELQLLLARCYEGQGAGEIAIGIYRGIIGSDPQRIPAYERLAELLARTPDRHEEAEAVLDTMLAANPDKAEALLAHARYCLNRGELSRSWGDAWKAFSLEPDAADTLCLMGELAGSIQRSGADWADFDEAAVVQAVDRAIEQAPTEARLYVALAQLHLAQGRTVDARRSLQQGISNAGATRRELELCLADLLIAEGQFDQAAELTGRLRKEGLDAVMTAVLYARLAMARGNWPEAFQQLSKVRNEPRLRLDLALQIELHLARCCEELRHPAWRLAAFRRAVQIAPASIEARFGLAAAAEEEGLLEESASIYRSLIERPGAALRLAGVLLRLNERRPADERSWDELTALCEPKDNQPDSPEWVLVRAESLAAQGQLAQAEDTLARGCSRFPESTDLRCAWAGALSRSGRLEAAEAILEKASREQGLTRNVIQTKLRLRAAAQAPPSPADLARGLLDQIHELPKAEQFGLIEACAEGVEHASLLDLAARLWDELAALAPDDVVVRRHQLDLALQGGDDAVVLSRIGDLRRIEGEQGIYWRLGKVRRGLRSARLGAMDELDDASVVLHEVAAEYPTEPGLPLLRAEIAEVRGDLKLAADNYRDAIDAGARSPEVLLKTARLLSQLQRFNEVEQLLSQFTPDYGQAYATELGRLSAVAALQSGQLTTAVARAKNAVRGEGKEFGDYIWLGTVLDAAGDEQEAEAAFREACKISPDVPSARLALVEWLVRHDRRAEADAELQSAVALLPEPQATITSARGYAILERNEEAAAKFAAALKLAPDDHHVVFAAAEYFTQTGNLAQAEPLWQKICQCRRKECERQLPDARRGLVACLAARGKHPQIMAALELLRLNAEQFGASSADLKLKARLLALEPARGMRKEAVAILTHLSENSALSLDDQLLLARLHASLGDWPTARAELQNLLTVRPDDADLLAFGIRQAIEHEADDLEHADGWLSRLAGLEPLAFRTLALRVRFLIAQLRWDEARQVLRAGWTAPEAGARSGAANDRGRWSRQAALLADELAERLQRSGNALEAEEFWNDAEDYWRACLELSPDRAPEVIQFLARRGRRDEALELAELRVAASTPAEIAFALVNALQVGQAASPDDIRRVRALLEQGLLAAAPSNPQLLFSLANLAQVERQYGEAERLYHRTLELDPGNVLAANNLAYLLGMRGGSRTEALKLINRALELAGPIPSLLDTRAVVYSAAGRHEDAIADLEQALAEGSAPAAEFHLCQALLASRRRGAARTAYQKLLASKIGAAQLHPLERTAWDQFEREMQVQ